MDSRWIKLLMVVVMLIAVTNQGLSQSQDSYEYQSEFTWGINKNTAGGLIGGLVFKKARKLSDKHLETFGLEVMNVKHPQERRINSPATGNYFIYGKSNYLYALRFQYGRDFILFTKAPQQGVEVKLVFAAGPSLGIVAPYYIERAADSGFSNIHEQWNPSIYVNEIYGTGQLFEGLGQSQLKIGGNLKAALNFELGVDKRSVTGFEAGFLLDAYAGGVELMPLAEQYSMYPTFFFTLFYGSRK